MTFGATLKAGKKTSKIADLFVSEALNPDPNREGVSRKINSITETFYENEQQNINLPDSICHNRYCHTGPNYSDNNDLCAAGKTGLV